MGRSLFAAGRGVLLALTLKHARAEEEESIGTSAPTPDAAAANPPHPSPLDTSPLDTSASGDGAQPSVSALSAMLQGLDWTNVALTVLVGLAIIVTLISQMPARRERAEHTQGEVKGKSAAAASSEAEEDVEEDVEEDAEEDVEEDGEEAGEEKAKGGATEEKPEEKEGEAPKGISEAQLLRKMDRLPMYLFCFCSCVRWTDSQCTLFCFCSCVRWSDSQCTRFFAFA